MFGGVLHNICCSTRARKHLYYCNWLKLNKVFLSHTSFIYSKFKFCMKVPRIIYFIILETVKIIEILIKIVKHVRVYKRNNICVTFRIATNVCITCTALANILIVSWRRFILIYHNLIVCRIFATTTIHHQNRLATCCAFLSRRYLYKSVHTKTFCLFI